MSDLFIWAKWLCATRIVSGSLRRNYMEYHGDLVSHYICNYWYEVGTKFDNCGTTFVELGTKYNPEVIKYLPSSPNTRPGGASRRRGMYLLT